MDPLLIDDTSETRPVDLDEPQISASGPAWLTPRRVLGLIGVVFVMASLVVAAATPWGEANDEPDHVGNVETLIDGHWYRIEDYAGLQPHQPPLYYLTLSAWQEALAIPPTIPERLYTNTPRTRARPAVLRHDLPGEGDWQRLFTLLRIPSIILGLITVLLTAVIARRLSRDPWTPVVAAAIVAFLPRFIFLSGVINNDNLANGLAAVATLLAVVLVTTELTPRRYLLGVAGLGLLAGLLALTKFSTLPLVAAFVLACILARARHRVWALITFGAAFIATSGWWLAMNTNWYGDPLAKQASEHYLRRAFPGLITDGMTVHRAFVDVPKTVWYSFVYTSGWNQFSWGDWWYLPFWLLFGIGLAGLALRRSPQFNRRALSVLAAIGALAFLSIWLVAINTTATAARIAFIGLPAIAVLVALGYERFRLPLPARFALPTLELVGFAIALHNDVLTAYWH